MEWLNDGVGLIVLVSAVIIVLLLGVAIALLVALRSKIATQKLKFLGFYSVDRDTRERYADCLIGNPSLNEIILEEIGIRNGKVSFNLTELYRRKANLTKEARVLVEQRSSIRFPVAKEELLTLLIDGKDKKELKTLSLYAVDQTGTLYKGKVKAIRKLLEELKKEAETGVPSHRTVEPAREAVEEPVDELVREEHGDEIVHEEPAHEVHGHAEIPAEPTAETSAEAEAHEVHEEAHEVHGEEAPRDPSEEK